MLFPIQPDAAQAEEATSKVKLTVNPVISISLQNALNVNVLPTQDGTFRSNTAALSISTNNETGYSLYMATSNGKNTLASQNPSISNVISAVDGGEDGVTSANFDNNTWGYNLSQEAVSDTTTYKAVPTATGDTALITTESPTKADTYNLTFGTKVDTSLPSGTYSNDVVVSVVANPAYVPSLNQIDNMQEMTSAICAASAENETKQLMDTRDGKKYWVTKLKDGHCWMTQNLDLDLSTSKALTPDDSDVSANWTPTLSTMTSIFSSTAHTGQYSWDPGYWVKSDPDGYSNYCGSSSGITSFADSDCASAGWTNVSSMIPMDNGTTDMVISGSAYNAHYLVGNLYQWNAATAGTGGMITSQDATDSICPKGWHLPTANNSDNASFQTLMNAYSIGNDSTKITQSPLYFHPSGHVTSGSLWSTGRYGYYWSSTAYSSTRSAYDFSFYSGGVDPSEYDTRYLGQSVRCLAR